MKQSTRISPGLIMAPVLILSIATLGWMLAAQPDPHPATSDTRPYEATGQEGLSLKLDLRLPEAPAQAQSQPDQIALSLNQSPADAASLAAPSSEGTAWPYFVFGLLALGASAAWLRKRSRVVTAAPARTRPQPPIYGLLDTVAAPIDEEAATAESLPPGEQFGTSVDLLKSHIELYPDESPVPWLLLLDLLHRTGKEEEYEKTRKQCKQHFNVDMPQYRKIKSAPHKQGIESYPHIMNKLIRLWPGAEAATYLNALLHDSRDGSRAGFDLTTYRDIALLRSILETVAAHAAPQDASASPNNPFASS